MREIRSQGRHKTAGPSELITRVSTMSKVSINEEYEADVNDAIENLNDHDCDYLRL